MKFCKYLLSLIVTLLLSFSAWGQITCDEFTALILEEGEHLTTNYSYSDKAISQIAFYRFTDSSYNDYYFALVTFKSNSYKEYTYQISEEAMNDYNAWSLDSDAERFWKYIQPYNQVLNCSPSERRGNQYSPRY